MSTLENGSDPLLSLRAAVQRTVIKNKRRKGGAADGREEGEISDSESAKPDSPSRSLLERISIQEPMPMRIRTPTPPPTPITKAAPPSPHTPTLGPITADEYARPGLPRMSFVFTPYSCSFCLQLQVTQDQYDIAKDHILDVLGWGVPPEELIDLGVSPVTIYYVFSELHLRFPRNLDVSHLDPSSSSPVQYRPDPPIPAPAAPRPVIGHPSLPPKPTLANNLALRIGVQTDDSHELEKQRRQELLARKAVQASRKSKVDPAIPEPSRSSLAPSPDIEMAPPAAVDDFLKSIGPDPEANMDMDVDYTDAQSRVPTASRSTTPGMPPLPLYTEPPLFMKPSNGLNRRNSKRPVATDFVDDEGAFHPEASRHPPLRHRPSGGFANIGMHRIAFVVDDDSDKEEDARVDSTMRDLTSRATPPVGNGYTAGNPLTSLEERMMAIQRMKDELQKKEQALLLKRSNVSLSDMFLLWR